MRWPAVLLCLGLFACGNDRALSGTALEITLHGNSVTGIDTVDIELALPGGASGTEQVHPGGALVEGTVIAVLPSWVEGSLDLIATARDKSNDRIAVGTATARITPFTLNHVSVTLVSLDGGPPPDANADAGSDGTPDLPHDAGTDVSDAGPDLDATRDATPDARDAAPDARDAAPDAPDASDLGTDALTDAVMMPDQPLAPCSGPLHRFFLVDGTPLCCSGALGAGGTSCIGFACTTDPNGTSSYPLCYQRDNPRCLAEGYRNLYGGEVGGFCCDDTLSADLDLCTMSHGCALDPQRAQGFPLCPSVGGNACVPGATYYGGFCCGVGGTVSNDICTGGTICALDPTRTEGFPICYQLNSPICIREGFTDYYGGEVGGFCCNGQLSVRHDVCNGGPDCALDHLRAQGAPLCPAYAATLCPAGSTLYGAVVGGFCCGPGGTIQNETCIGGTACALDPSRAQGNPLCPPP